MKYEKKTATEIVEALKKTSFRINMGKGAVAVYPDEFLAVLYGESIINDICLENFIQKSGEQIGAIEQLEKLSDIYID